MGNMINQAQFSGHMQEHVSFCFKYGYSYLHCINQQESCAMFTELVSAYPAGIRKFHLKQSYLSYTL